MRRRAVLFVPLLAGLAAPALLAGCSPTATYGTGEAPEVAMFREMTGSLLSIKKEEPIEYQPRAPLVMPPENSGNLPPPVETASATAPNWPVSREDRIAAMQAGNDDPRYAGSQAEYRRLKPLVGVLPEPPRGQDELGTPYDIVHSKRQQEQLRKAIAEAEGFGAGNERRFLTDPPTQYRQPAASAPAEFEDINGGSGGSRTGGFLRWLMGER